MSFSGFVICDCYQKGKTTEPPYKEYMVFDEDGLYLEFPDNPNATEKDWDDEFEKEREFNHWKDTACPHEEMEYVYENIANNMGMSGFRAFIAENGGEKEYPVLSKYLPESNGGCLPANKAQDAYNELQKLQHNNKKIDKVVLRNKKTDEIIMIGDYDDDIPFGFFDKNKMFLLSNEGFHILEEKETEQYYIIFQSTDFTEYIENEKNTTFVCNKTKRGLSNCSMSLRNDMGESVNEYIVEKKQYDSSFYWNSVIVSLEKLLIGSIEVGNPVHWC